MDSYNSKRDSFFSTGASDSARNSFFSTGVGSMPAPGHLDMRHLRDQDAVEGNLVPASPEDFPDPIRSPKTAASAKADLLAALRRMTDDGPQPPLAAGAHDAQAPQQTSVVETTPKLSQQPLVPNEDATGSVMMPSKDDALAADPAENLPPVPLPLRARKGRDQTPTGFASSSATASDELGVGGSGPGQAHVLTEDNAVSSRPSAQVDEAQDETDLEFWLAVSPDTDMVQLTQAVRAGIPAQVRGTVWQELSGGRDIELETAFAALRVESSEHDKAIQRDLARTYPDQTYFRDASQGQQDLFDVVKAYALYDDEVGYCQGIQFIVGPLLLIMDAPQAFSTMVALMQKYDLRSHFVPGMPGLQLRLYQFGRMMEERLPKLYAHLARSGVKSNMYASPWLMTLFCYRFPLAVAYRVLDTIFIGGLDALSGFVLALLATNEAKLLSLEFEDAVLFLKHNIFDAYRLPDALDSPDDPHRAEGDSSPVKKRSTWTAERYAVNRFAREAAEAREAVRAADLCRWAQEYEENQQKALAPSADLEKLRLETWKLAAKVKELEDNAALQETAHIELAKQVVSATLAKDEVGEQLVRYKTLYAEAALAQARQSLAPPQSPLPSNGKKSNKNANSSAMPASVQTEHASTGESLASDTSVVTTASGTVTTVSDRSAGGGAPTVAQSVSATVASWGRWMSRSKSNKAAATPSPETDPGASDQESPADEVAHEGDASHAESLDVSDSVSDAGGHGPPPLPPRRASPLPPHASATAALLPAYPARAAGSDLLEPALPRGGAGSLGTADTSWASVTPCEAGDTPGETVTAAADSDAETSGADAGHGCNKTPSASPGPSWPSGRKAGMEPVPREPAS